MRRRLGAGSRGLRPPVVVLWKKQIIWLASWARSL